MKWMHPPGMIGNVDKSADAEVCTGVLDRKSDKRLLAE